MAHFYGILAIMGWAWAIFVAIALPMMIAKRNRDAQQGIGVASSHEKHD